MSLVGIILWRAYIYNDDLRSGNLQVSIRDFLRPDACILIFWTLEQKKKKKKKKQCTTAELLTKAITTVDQVRKWDRAHIFDKNSSTKI